MKKDLLFGIKGKSGVGIGVILWLLTKLVAYMFPSLPVTIIIIGEVCAIWFFVIGLYKWNKDMKAQKK